MNHYTYFLTAKEPFNGMKYYIGARSCKVNPEEDKYLGSSKIINTNKIAVEKHILATWKTREEAISHEILLHDCFDIARNKEFFNQAKQTAVKFDTSGKIPHNKGKKATAEHREKNRKAQLGKKISEEAKQKMSLANKGRKFQLITCPKCNTVGGATTMKRWHFDNCTGAKIFIARTTINGKRLYLGKYATKEQVNMAIKNAQLGVHNV